MELLDVFTDVDTPDGSYAEVKPEEPILVPPKSCEAEMLLEKILAAKPHPMRDVQYSELYSYWDYKQNVAKKMAKMIRTTDSTLGHPLSKRKRWKQKYLPNFQNP